MDLGLQIYFVSEVNAVIRMRLWSWPKSWQRSRKLSGRPSPESEKRNDFSKGQKHGSLCSFPESEKYQQLLSSPNNILGIEYCKAILRENSSISPVSIKREGNDYHENTLSENHFPSASAIRNAILDFNVPPKGDWSNTKHSHCFLSEASETSIQNFAFLSDMAKKFLPANSLELFLQAISEIIIFWKTIWIRFYRYCLLQETEESLCTYLDMSHALARRILSCRDQYETFSPVCQPSENQGDHTNQDPESTASHASSYSECASADSLRPGSGISKKQFCASGQNKKMRQHSSAYQNCRMLPQCLKTHRKLWIY